MVQVSVLKPGKCKHVDECSYPQKLLQENQIPPFCNESKGSTDLVCCPAENLTSAEKYLIGDPNVYPVSSGSIAEYDDAPHMTAVGYKNDDLITWLCGGSIISEYFILTAAHCTKYKNITPNVVRVGGLDIENDTETAYPEDISISEIYVHKDYTFSLHYHDVALLKLAKHLHFVNRVVKRSIAPARLHTEKSFPLEILQVTGWGKTEGQPTTHLLKASVQIIDHKTCAERYANKKRKLPNGIMDEIQICAGGDSGEDTCSGDSGGPLHYFYYSRNAPYGKRKYVIAGITSFGLSCGTGYPSGVYTRVSAYVPWIESIVWPSDKPSNITTGTKTRIADGNTDINTTFSEGDYCNIVDKNGSVIAGNCLKEHKCDYNNEFQRTIHRNKYCGDFETNRLLCCPIHLNPISVRSCFVRAPVVEGYYKLYSYSTPTMAAVGYFNGTYETSFCIGVLVTGNFVLTTAHCTKHFKRNSSREYLIPNMVRIQQIKIFINKIYTHPNYNASSRHHNIALLKLKQGLKTGTHIPNTCLHVYEKLPSELDVVLDKIGPTDSFNLNGTLKIYKCNYTEQYGNLRNESLGKYCCTNKMQFCARGDFGVDRSSYLGQLLFSHVPEKYNFYSHYEVVGIVSKVVKYQSGKKIFGFYIKISEYLQWIENIIWSSQLKKNNTVLGKLQIKVDPTMSSMRDNNMFLNKSQNIADPSVSDYIIFENATTSQFEGDVCVLSDSNHPMINGKCTNVNHCDYAKELLRKNKKPQVCGFAELDSIVCCPKYTEKPE